MPNRRANRPARLAALRSSFATSITTSSFAGAWCVQQTPLCGSRIFDANAFPIGAAHDADEMSGQHEMAQRRD
jgi:hypothetical protein